MLTWELGEKARRGGGLGSEEGGRELSAGTSMGLLSSGFREGGGKGAERLKEKPIVRSEVSLRGKNQGCH